MENVRLGYGQALRLKEFYSLLNRLSFLLFFESFRHINFVKVTRVPSFPSRRHRKDSSENHSGNGNNGAFLASAFGNLLEINAVIRRLFRFHGCACDLHARRLEVNSRTCNANRLLLTGRSLLPGVNPAQQHRRFEEMNWVTSVPISEMIVMADWRSTPRVVLISVIRPSCGATIVSISASICAMDYSI